MVRNLLLVFLFIITSISFVFSQQIQKHIYHYTINDGLSQSAVFAITQDAEGFMWLGTQDGLNRFDGYNFKLLQTINSDSTFKLPDNYIQCLYYGKNNMLWVGTRYSGLCAVDLKNKTVRIFSNESEPSQRITGNSVISILEDKTGHVWAGTTTGLNEISINANKTISVRQFVHDAKDKKSLSSNSIAALAVDHDGVLWCGTDKGLNKINLQHQIVSFYKDSLDENSLAGNSIAALCVDHKNNLWIGTRENGFDKMNLSDFSFTHYFNQKKVKTFSSNRIRSICEDNNNHLWVGTSRGVNILNMYNESVEILLNNEADLLSLSNNMVYQVFTDKSGTVWIGTEDGINKISPYSNQFTHLKFSKNEQGLNINDNIWAICESDNQTLWLGSAETGLYFYDAEKNILKASGEKNTEELNSQSVFSIVEDSRKNIFVGTDVGLNKITIDKKGNWKVNKNFPNMNINQMIIAADSSVWIATWNGGIAELKTNTNELNRYYAYTAKGEINKDENYTCIYEDHNHLLWMGTETGLKQFDRATKKIIPFHRKEIDEQKMYRRIACMIEDNKKNLWVGTLGGGLFCYNFTTQQFKFFSDKTGLPNNNINAIVKDKNGMFWISTNKGIIKFNPENYSIEKYYDSNGLQSDEFNSGSSCMGKSGRIYFGGLKGLNLFYPDAIKPDRSVLPVVITSFKTQNNRVNTDLSYVENTELEIPYQDLGFTVEFSALNYVDPLKNNYEYKLEGLDNDWIRTGNRRYISYSNLSPGKYILKIRAANSNEIWSEAVKELYITVTPPYWKTWWFRGILIFALLAFIFYILLQQKQTSESEKKKEVAENATRLKEQFLANMSHEIRTPMNAIIGFTDYIMMNEMKTDEQNNYLKAIKESANNLLVIINEILDFSKIESGTLEFEEKPFSIKTIIEQVKNLLIIKIKEKGLDFYIDIDANIPNVVMGDEVKFNQIITNLLGNAIKFTDKGSIRLNATLLNNQDNVQTIQFEIIDSGVGIPTDKLQTIFESFIQINNQKQKNHSGTGLGLTITKQLVEKQNGQVFAENQPGGGTKFTVILPFKSDVSNAALKSTSPIFSDDSLINHPFSVLIADDNNFNILLTQKIIEKKYSAVTIHVAENGLKAFEVTSKNKIDIILMDIRMPEMDGYDASLKIRKELSFATRLPIVALTASATTLEIKKCFECGMDDYLTKPFIAGDLYNKINLHLGLNN